MILVEVIVITIVFTVFITGINAVLFHLGDSRIAIYLPPPESTTNLTSGQLILADRLPSF